MSAAMHGHASRLHGHASGLDVLDLIASWPSDTLHTSDGNAYMERYYLGGQHVPVHDRTAVRLHHFLGSDPGRDLHDHPWDFTTVLLTGGYVEHTEHGRTIRNVGDVVHHRAEDLHRVELLEPTWTLFLHGPARRRWGFLTPTGWVYWGDYPAVGYVANND